MPLIKDIQAITKEPTYGSKFIGHAFLNISQKNNIFNIFLLYGRYVGTCDSLLVVYQNNNVMCSLYDRRT
jgi:hypothetical protein